MRTICISVLTLAMALPVFLSSSCGGESPPEQDASVIEEAPSDTAAVIEEEVPVPPEDVPGTEAPSETADGPQGSWDTTMGEMVFVVSESGEITGEYPLGTVSGTLDGHTMEYTYAEGSLTGDGTFEFDENFGSFSGVQDIAGTELVWEGRRI
ncbi:MAG: hypothetical protein JXA64_04860 [Candidatus Fermentibacteraceae bacterium]|nr:hypothetical protein [Candidatus Fermentibacteraceae bacterium]MBN2608425.1 hypothetical protein [Candidatus Fermentibacteraceae bacterium]